jgi:hypothetical protein
MARSDEFLREIGDKSKVAYNSCLLIILDALLLFFQPEYALSTVHSALFFQNN